MTTTPVFSAHLSGTGLGTLRLWATRSGIRRLDFEGGPDSPSTGETLSLAGAPTLLEHALQQLRAYLAGDLSAFTVSLDLDPGVTAFRRRVYDCLTRIPFGQVTTYGRIAEEIGADPTNAARAVGQAIGANPVPILIPCHRVVGANGRLTGFGGGTGRKATLLTLEGVDVDGALASSKVHPEVLRLPL